MIEKILSLLILVAVLMELLYCILCKVYEMKLHNTIIKRDGKLFGKLSKRYRNYFELGKPVSNSYSFVRVEIEGDYSSKKYIHFIHSISMFCILLSAVFTLFMFFASLFNNTILVSINIPKMSDRFIYLQVIGISLNILCDRFIDMENVINKASIMIVDYLENSVAQKYREKYMTENYVTEKIEKEKQAKKTEKIETIEAQNSIGQVISNTKDNQEAEQIISQILQEYLV